MSTVGYSHARGHAGSPGPGVLARGWMLVLAAMLAGVLAFGATLPFGVLMIECLVTVGALAVFLSRDPAQAQTFRAIFRPMALFAAVVLVQLMLNRTAYWAATYAETLLYATYALALISSAWAFSRESNLRIFAWTLVVFGAAYAMFAVIQQLTSPQELYWVLKPRSGGNVYGSYVNHNHFAGLMEMLTPFPIVLAFRDRVSTRQRIALLSCGALMATAIVMSQSRGGTVALLVQLIFLGILLRVEGRASRRIQVAGLVLAIILLIGWVGADRIISRWSEPIADPVRAGVLKDAPHMWMQHPLLGWGLGAFPTVYPHFRSYVTEYFVNQAHNDLLQVLLETGLLGLAAALWFLFEMYRAGLAGASKTRLDFCSAARMASAIGCTGIVVHSFTDFNLHIPANTLVFFVLAGVASSSAKNVLPFPKVIAD
jgi:O-antigen ligase